MAFTEKTLDLTMFNRRTWAGRFRLRHLFDWAGDYWEHGTRLAKVRLSEWEYRELLAELRNDNIYLNKDRITENLTVDCGFGPIEIEEGEPHHAPEPKIQR
jgi:hypothetical protein